MRGTKVPERVRAHLLANPRQKGKEAAAALGIAPGTLRMYRHLLVQEGVVPRLQGCAAVDVYDLVREGLTYAEIAQQRKVTPWAVDKRMRALGVRAPDVRADLVYSTGDLARIFGYCRDWCRDLLRRWERDGLIEVRRRAGKGRRELRVTALALMAFLERPDSPMPVDPDWRQYAEAARAGKLKPVKVLDMRVEKAKPLCPECGRPATREGRLCRPCATRLQNQRRYAAAD